MSIPGSNTQPHQAEKKLTSLEGIPIPLSVDIFPSVMTSLSLLFLSFASNICLDNLLSYFKISY